MNKRIKQLVAESGNGLMRDGQLYPHIGSRTETDWQRFAELIVRECCGILTENVEVALDASGSPVYPEGLIYEHFGVEE